VLFFALRGGVHMESHRVFLVMGGLCAAAAWVTLAWLRRHQRTAP